MTEAQAAALSAAIQQTFGPGTAVEREQSGRAGRYRFDVSSPAFGAMTHLARQDALWDVVDRVLPRADTLDVAMILAFAPADLEEVQG